MGKLTASSHAVAGSAGRFRGCEPYLTRKAARGAHGRSCSAAAWRAAAIKSSTCHTAGAALRGKVAVSAALVPRLFRGCEPYLTRKAVRGAHGRSCSAAAWRAAVIKSSNCRASTLWRGSSISTLLTAPRPSFDAESDGEPYETLIRHRTHITQLVSFGLSHFHQLFANSEICPLGMGREQHPELGGSRSGLI